MNMNDMNVNLSNLSKSYYKGFITGSQALTGREPREVPLLVLFTLCYKILVVLLKSA